MRVKANKGAAGVDEQSIEEFEQDLTGTCTSSGIGCRREATSRRRCARWRYRRRTAARECSGCRPSRTGSPRWSCARIWSRRWSRCSTRTPMGIGRGVPPTTRWGSAGSGVGGTTGCSIWTSGSSSTPFRGTSCSKAVAHHTDQRWILLYVERWLKAPLQREDGTLVERDRGTPQGSAISPLLANMFMHYAFDAWMAREFPAVPFERYCDDIIVHARSERQARQCGPDRTRLAECGLELNEQKTRIVYCKDDDRRGSHEHTSFTSSGTRSARGCRRTGSGSTS